MEGGNALAGSIDERLDATNATLGCLTAITRAGALKDPSALRDRLRLKFDETAEEEMRNLAPTYGEETDDVNYLEDTGSELYLAAIQISVRLCKENPKRLLRGSTECAAIACWIFSQCGSEQEAILL